jgi:hypothetical protein
MAQSVTAEPRWTRCRIGQTMSPGAVAVRREIDLCGAMDGDRCKGSAGADDSPKLMDPRGGWLTIPSHLKPLVNEIDGGSPHR